MEPTFNSTIEPHPVPSKAEIISEIQPIYTPPPREELPLPPEPIKPHRQPAMGPADWDPPPQPCCGRSECALPSAPVTCGRSECALPSVPSTYDTDPLALFNALGAALGVGVAIGGLLVYAFSRPTVVEVLE